MPAATIGKEIRICIRFNYSRAMPDLSINSIRINRLVRRFAAAELTPPKCFFNACCTNSVSIFSRASLKVVEGAACEVSSNRCLLSLCGRPCSLPVYTVLQFTNVTEPAMTINSTKCFGREAQIFLTVLRSALVWNSWARNAVSSPPSRKGGKPIMTTPNLK